MITVKADTAALLTKLQAYPAAFTSFMEEQVKIEAKGGIRDAIKLTPPGKVGAGNRAVIKDVRGVFIPVRLKGYRVITKAFGHPIKPVRVATKERWPDAEGIYAGRIRKKTGGKISRGQKQAYYVASAKVTAVTTRRRKGVGRLASGWMAAAQKVGVKVPQWIARHRVSNGAVTEDKKTSSYTLSATNRVRYGGRVGITRVAERVKQLRAGKLERRLPYALRAVLKKVNL